MTAVNNNSTIRPATAIDIFHPNNATIPTSFSNTFLYDGAATLVYQSAVGVHNLTSSADFDGFTIIPDAGTVSGIISVYGYNK